MRLIACLAILLSLPATALAERIGSLDVEPCHLPNHRQELLCGRHAVPLDRSNPDSGSIELHFAIVPAIGEAKQPDPLVFFAGGPGQAASDLVAVVRHAFGEVNRKRDLILIDQRGMGRSQPLECDMPDGGLDLDLAARSERVQEALAACLDALDTDVTLYTQDRANQDIHDIVEALGYTRVNLYGGSWGTRSALLYAHRYPDQVRTVVLDGALPLANTAPLHAAIDGDRALEALFDDCAADAHCSAAHPDLEQDYRAMLARLDALEAPVSVTDPLTGETESVQLTAAFIGALFRNILYSAELGRVVPWLIHRASEGDLQPLLGVSSFLATGNAGNLTIGATLTIFCSEEFARMGGAETDQDTLIGTDFFDGLNDACDVWPNAPLPEIYRENVRIDAPTLILSGAVDPITPPRWGEAMAELASESLHLVASATGHGVAPVGCAPELVAEFIEQGGLEDIDGTCLAEIERPSFFIDAAGPRGNP